MTATLKMAWIQGHQGKERPLLNLLKSACCSQSKASKESYDFVMSGIRVESSVADIGWPKVKFHHANITLRMSDRQRRRKLPNALLVQPSHAANRRNA